MPTMTRTMTLMKKRTKSTKITKNLQLQRVEKTLVIDIQAIHDTQIIKFLHLSCKSEDYQKLRTKLKGCHHLQSRSHIYAMSDPMVSRAITILGWSHILDAMSDVRCRMSDVGSNGQLMRMSCLADNSNSIFSTICSKAEHIENICILC